MYGQQETRWCRKPWNESLSKVVSERRGFQLIAQCQVHLDDDEHNEDGDRLIAERQEFLTSTELIIRVCLNSVIVACWYSSLIWYRARALIL